jgi:hypothetical protein
LHVIIRGKIQVLITSRQTEKKHLSQSQQTHLAGSVCHPGMSIDSGRISWKNLEIRIWERAKSNQTKHSNWK